MKILSNSQYKELETNISELEKQIRDLKKKNDDNKVLFATKISNVICEKEEQLLKNSQLLEELNNIKSETILIKEKNDSLERTLKSLEEKIKVANGRLGGLTKENNKLQNELKISNEKIENYKIHLENNRIKLTPKQYDLRLKPSKRRK